VQRREFEPFQSRFEEPSLQQGGVYISIDSASNEVILAKKAITTQNVLYIGKLVKFTQGPQIRTIAADIELVVNYIRPAFFRRQADLF